jgi:hypothetical protein
MSNKELEKMIGRVLASLEPPTEEHEVYLAKLKSDPRAKRGKPGEGVTIVGAKSK